MKSKLSKSTKHKFLFLLLLFIYIYAPPFNLIPFSPNKILSPIALFGCLLVFKKSIQKLIFQKHIALFIFFVFISMLYALVIDSHFIMSNNLSFTEKDTYNQALTLMETIPIALFLCIYAIRKLKLCFAELLSSIVTIAAIQSLFAIVMLLLPNLRMYILTTILKYNTHEDKIFRADLYSFRSFGISQDYLFSLSIVQGISVVCILCICIYNFSKYKYLLLLIPMLLLSIALNARIGFIAIILFVVIALFFTVARLKLYLLSKFLLFLLISILSIYFSISNINLFSNSGIENNLEWASKVFIEGKNFARGSETETGHFGRIQNKHIHLPKTEFARIFGEGRYVFANKKSSLDSDVGYVRRIYFGGYIYSLLTYSSLIYLFIGSQQKKQKDIFKIFLYCILLTAFLAQIKGDIFLPIPGYRIIFLIFSYVIAERRLMKPKLLTIPGIKITKQYLPTR